MKKLSSSRIALMIIGVTSILALAFVISGLAGFEFQPAVPFSVKGGAEKEGILLEQMNLSLKTLIIISVTILLFLTLLSFIVMTPKQRRRFLLVLLFLFIVLLILGYVINASNEVALPTQPAYTPTVEFQLGELTTPLPTVVPSEFVEPPVSPWISYVVAFLITLAVTLLGWFLVIRRRVEVVPSLERIAQEAIEDLQSGKDWSRTVEGAYLRMVETVQARRGLHRSRHITPTEFSAILVQVGLPVAAVQRLTLLFEHVRYGGKRSTRKDIDEAVNCLTEIVDACQEIDA